MKNIKSVRQRESWKECCKKGESCVKRLKKPANEERREGKIGNHC